MKRIFTGFLFIACIAFAGALMTGCGTTGKSFDSSKVTNIKNQATTKQEILSWFGTPYKEGVENGHAMWTYQQDRYEAGGKDTSKDLVVLFNEKDVVIAYRYTSTGQ